MPVASDAMCAVTQYHQLVEMKGANTTSLWARLLGTDPPWLPVP